MLEKRQWLGVAPGALKRGNERRWKPVGRTINFGKAAD